MAEKPEITPDTCIIRVNNFPRELWDEFTITGIIIKGKKEGKVANILAEAIALWLKKNKK